MEKKGCYVFDNYRADLTQRVLLRDGEILRITPKAFEVLVVLLEKAGRVVTRDDIMDQVWPDTAVEPNNLAYQVKAIRDVLGDSSESPHYIEGLPRRGYRFIPDARFVPDDAAEPAASITSDRGRARSIDPGSQLNPLRDDKTRSLPSVAVSQLILPIGGHQTAKHASGWKTYRTLVAIAGLIAALFAAADLLWLRPPDAGRARDAVLLAFAVAAFWGYAVLSKRGPRPSPALPEIAAFRGLLPFDRSDAARFYGRDIDTAALFDLVTHSDFRFGVLYGDSGAGKSSLIRAGLLPRLNPAGFNTIYCKTFKNPIASLLEQSQLEMGIARLEDEDTIGYLKRVSEETGRNILIVLDQFEEFFINSPTSEAGAEFVSFVARCFHTNALPVRFLVGIRSDFLYLVASAFDEEIPETLATSRRYHLRHFNQIQAAAVLEQSMVRANWNVELGLSSEVAADLAANDRVLPSELQIVGEQLQNKRIFTVSAYNRAGRKEQLVYAYLADVVELSGDRESAHLLLRALVSDENTRLKLTASDISRRIQRSVRTIDRLIKLFIQNRLITAVQDEQVWRYELTHEYAIGLINRLTGNVMDARQRANLFFRRYLSDYEFDLRTRIPLRRWWFITRHSDIPRGTREKKLLKNSFINGLVTSVAIALILFVLIAFCVAMFSVREEWRDVPLRDGHTSAVHRAVFSPDGRLLISGGEDGRVIVWDFARRQQLASLGQHSNWVTTLAFSPDGKLFASGGSDHRLIVWDTSSLSVLRVIEQDAAVCGVAFSPDGRFLAAAAAGAPATVWSVGDWQERWRFPESDGISCVLFSRDGHLLNLGGSEAWDISTGKKTRFASDHDRHVTFESYFANGTRVASVDSLGYVTFLDVTTGNVISRHKAHRDNGRAVAASSDGGVVATGSENIVLWDGHTLEKIVRLEYPSIVWSLDFSPDGKWLVSTHGDGSIVIWDAAEHERVANLSEHSRPVRAVCFSQNGALLASASEDQSIIVWDAVRLVKAKVLIGHANRVTGVAFSPDNSTLFSTDQDGVTVSWDLNQATPRWKKQAPGGNMCLALSPNGRWLAVSHAVYDADDGTELASSREGTASDIWQSWGSWGASFSPDNRWLIFPGNGTGLWVIDTSTWRLSDHQTLTNHAIVSVAFSRSVNRFVTGDDEGKIKEWQLGPLREVALLGQHSARTKSVSFSPDGTEVVSASDDQTIALWNAGGGLKSLIGTHAAPIVSVAFSNDGQRIACGTHDNKVRIYIRQKTLFGFRVDRLPIWR